MGTSYRKNRGEDYFAAVFLCLLRRIGARGGDEETKKSECVFEKTIGNPSEIRYHTIINREGCE